MKLDRKIVDELAVRFQPRNYLRVMPKIHSGKPLGMGYGGTRVASPDRSFKLIYIAKNLMTGIAETIVRDRFDDQNDRTLHVSEVSDWSVSTIVVQKPLILVDLRTTGLLKLGVTTDASRAKAQEAGRLLSQELYKRFAVDGVLYLSRLTAAECIAVYDRAVGSKLKASNAMEIERLAALIPALTALGVTLVDDR